MDRTEHYKRIVKEVVEEYKQYPPSVGQMQLWSACDDAQGHYALFYAGWNQGKRAQGHLCLFESWMGKSTLNMTVSDMAFWTVSGRKGVNRDDVVLNFTHAPVSEPVA